MRRYCRSTVLIVSALVLSLGIGSAYAAYPDKPIVLVAGSGAGSGTDIVCRLIAGIMEKHKLLAQPVVVENKVGGSHAVAMAYVAGKKKDPYYLVANTTLFLLTPLQGKSPVSYKDFTPISNLWFDEHMLIVNANSKFKTLKDVIETAKAKPETVTMGGAHLGGVESINTYFIEKEAGVKFKYVSFGGGGDAITALLGGHLDLASANPGEIIDLVKGGKIRMLALLGNNRLPDYPSISTAKEQGINVTGVGMWRGFAAPAGIPDEARKVLDTAFLKLAQTEDYKKFTKDNLLVASGLDSVGYQKYLDNRNEALGSILKEMGLLVKK